MVVEWCKWVVIVGNLELDGIEVMFVGFVIFVLFDVEGWFIVYLVLECGMCSYMLLFLFN